MVFGMAALSAKNKKEIMKRKDIHKIMKKNLEKLVDFLSGLLVLLQPWLTSRDYMNVPAMKIVNASKLQLIVSAYDGNIIEVGLHADE